LRALAEAAYDALNRRDLEAFLALVTDDVEFTSLIAEAEGTSFHGHEGVRTWWDTVPGSFEDVRWELLSFDASGDRGLMQLTIVGTIGGVPVEQTMWQASRMRDGRVCWWGLFRTEDEARAAIGLTP
jgi:ketosteroid isomerase-like protein